MSFPVNKITRCNILWRQKTHSQEKEEESSSLEGSTGKDQRNKNTENLSLSVVICRLLRLQIIDFVLN